MKRPTLLLVLIALALAACRMAPTTIVPATPGPPCSDEEAMAIIRAFAGRPDLALTAHGATSEARPWERNFTAGPGGIFTVGVEPQVSRERVQAIAGERFGARVTESRAELSVWWRHNDRAQGQVLRWQVRLQSDEPISAVTPQITKKAAYTIDAQTGEVLEETR